MTHYHDYDNVDYEALGKALSEFVEAAQEFIRPAVSDILEACREIAETDEFKQWQQYWTEMYGEGDE